MCVCTEEFSVIVQVLVLCCMCNVALAVVNVICVVQKWILLIVLCLLSSPVHCSVLRCHKFCPMGRFMQ